MSRVRVKICGITRVEDGQAAADAGADAIGLVFFPPSPRAVSRAQARLICMNLPPFVNRVGLFVNEDRETIEQTLADVPIDTLQFHGDETPEYCASFGVPYVKSVGVKPGVDVRHQMALYHTASAVLLDQHDRVRWGGTGETFDWALVPGERPVPLILAGGLTDENVANAVRTVGPDAVDVSGGVECSKGIKDAARIQAFIRGLQGVRTD
jgi:phosphoribosylanthranilate isomerase